MNLSQKGIVLVSVPLLFEIVFVCLLWHLLSTEQLARTQAEISRTILARSDRAAKHFYDAGSLLLAYKLTHSAVYAARFNSVVSGIKSDLHDIKVLARTNTASAASLKRLDVAVTEGISLLQSAKSTLDSEGEFSLIKRSERDREKIEKAMVETITALKEVNLSQHKTESSSPADLENLRRLLNIVLASGIILNVLLAFWLATFFNRTTIRRLNRVLENTKRLAQAEPLNPTLDGSDEIADLDRVFHDMALSINEAARKERAVVENALDIICTIDSSQAFKSVNPAVERLLGYSQSELIDKPINAIIQYEQEKSVEDSFQKAKQDGSATVFETRIKCKDGSLVDLSWSIFWSELENRFFCVAHDITSRKELERMKQEFLAMVSHDLRTPLGTVQMFLDMLGAGIYGKLSESGNSAITTISGSVDRLVKLVNDLLTMEKIEAGGMEICPTPCSTSEILSKAVDSVTAIAQERNIDIRLDAAENISLIADGDRIVQVLVNLLSNAIKFSPVQEQVIVSVIALPAQIEIKVTDRGKGIAPEFQEVIFHRFRQISATDSKLHEGAGLGLSICKSIVELHGGTIGIESDGNKGSCFWFHLPRDSSLKAVSNPQVKDDSLV